MKLRNEIEEKDKWDLSGYFKDDDEFLREFNYLKTQTNFLNGFKGKLNNEESILECLEKDQEMSKRLETLFVYSVLKTREDAANSFYQERQTQVGSLLTEFSTNSSFISVEIKKNPNSLLKKLMEESQFKNYFKGILRNKKHILSEKEEKLLSMSGDMAGGFSENFDMFNDADLKFPNVKDSKGNKYELNHSNFMQLLKSSDRTLRKNAFISLNGEYGKFNNFLSSNYISEIKSNVFYARASKYKNCLDKSIFLEEADRKVYNKLIECVNENLDVIYDYYELKRESQNLKNFAIYDQFAIEKEVDKKYTFDQAFDIVKKAVSPLGEKYLEILEKAKTERWIDKYPNKNKDSGAFSWGAYKKNPVLLLNFVGDTQSLFTLAHELGHSMHTYFSNLNQNYDQSGYKIFVAEVASIVNEMMLLRYLERTTKTKAEKIYYIDHFLSELKSTVFRQTMFSEFEQFAHETYEKSLPISAEVLNNFYYDLNKKYFGKKVKLVPQIKYEWSRIPHFYNSFYVYKYAIGMISALYLVDKVIPTEPEKYIKFLSSGSIKPPIDLLFDAGVNLKTNEPFEKAFDLARTYLKKWRKNLI